MSYFFNYTPEDGLRTRGRMPPTRDANGGADNFIETVLNKRPDDGPKKRHRGTDRRSGAQQVPFTPTLIQESPAGPDGRPASPDSHMTNLRRQVRQPREVEEVGENKHRHTWFPATYLQAAPGRTRLPDTKGPDAKQTLGKGPKVWGLLTSDYGTMNKQYEQGLAHKRHLQRSGTDPGLLPRVRENPSMVSRGTNACMVGGTNLSLSHQVDPSMRRTEKRQIGLYEDSFLNYRGHYKPAAYGLPSSDVTYLVGEIVKQQNLMRK